MKLENRPDLLTITPRDRRFGAGEAPRRLWPGGRGEALDAPLTVDADIAWAGYANRHIRAQIEPLLLQALRRRGWI